MIFTNFSQFLNGEIKQALLFLSCFFLWSTMLGQSSHLFDTDDVMELNLKGDLKTVFKDRGDDPQYHKATLQYKVDSNTINIPSK